MGYWNWAQNSFSDASENYDKRVQLDQLPLIPNNEKRKLMEIDGI